MRARRWLGWGILLGVAAAVAAWALLGGRGAADGVLVGLVSDELAPTSGTLTWPRSSPSATAWPCGRGRPLPPRCCALARRTPTFSWPPPTWRRPTGWLAGRPPARPRWRAARWCCTPGPSTSPLEAAGLVGRAADGTLTVSLPRLAEAALAGRTWPDLGLPGLPAPLALALPDPARSDVGALLAWEGARAAEGASGAALPGLRALLAGQGYRYRSSGDLFAYTGARGPGPSPGRRRGGRRTRLPRRAPGRRRCAARRGACRLYLQPAAWVDWTVVALSDRAVPLIDVLRSAEAQRLALERYGLRGDPAQPAALPADLPALPGAAQPPDAASVLAVLRALEE